MGYTITPHVEINAEGQEVVTDFDIGERGGYNSAYDNDYVLDHQGRVHHRFEDVELNEDGYDEDFLNDDTAQLMKELVGGAGVYQQMVSWAAQNLHPQDIDAFDALVDQATQTGDYGELEEAIQALYQEYQEAGGLDYEDYEDDDIDDRYFPDDEEFVSIRETVFDAVGGADQYLQMVFWASENCADEFIDWYDDAMDSRDADRISEAVGSLYDMYSN